MNNLFQILREEIFDVCPDNTVLLIETINSILKIIQI